MSAYSRHQHKRHGKHQKHTRNFLKVYTPYLPLMVIVTLGLVVSVLMPPQLSSKTIGKNQDVLAYATSMSSSALLQATNQQRTSRGLVALKINSKLQSAAQTKANDMVSRDYWAHDPPYAGEYWWEFVKNAGYKYQSLGENLAYGFSNSQDTVSGWMASPEHRDNMLNNSYMEVGFGYTNGSNFNNSGPETVVVAEYALPISTVTATAPAATSSSGSTKAVASSVASNAVVSEPNHAAKPKTSKTSTQKPPVAITASTNNQALSAETPTIKVSRISYLTGGNLPWLASVITIILFASLAALALRHTIAIRKWFRRGERYVLHHALFDVTIISLIALCVILNQSPNLFIR